MNQTDEALDKFLNGVSAILKYAGIEEEEVESIYNTFCFKPFGLLFASGNKYLNDEKFEQIISTKTAKWSTYFVDHTKLTEKSLANLIRLHKDHIDHLIFSYCPLEDSSLSSLLQLESIITLDFSGVKFASYEPLSTLSSMFTTRNLKCLALKDCGITTETICKFVDDIKKFGGGEMKGFMLDNNPIKTEGVMKVLSSDLRQANFISFLNVGIEKNSEKISELLVKGERSSDYQKGICFAENSFSAAAMQNFGKTLNWEIGYDFSNCGLTDKHLSEFAKGIQCLTDIDYTKKMFVFTGNCFTDTGFIDFIKIFETNRSDMSNIVEVYQPSSLIIQLNQQQQYNNKYRLLEYKYFCYSKHQINYTKFYGNNIYLSRCNITSKSIEKIIEIIKKLKENPFGKLVLSETKIGIEGIKMILECSQTIPFRFVQLDGIQIGDAGIAEIMSLLKKAQIKELWLNSTNISDEGMGILGGISENKTIRSLYLNNNTFGTKGVVDFIRNMKDVSHELLLSILPFSCPIFESFEMEESNLTEINHSEFLVFWYSMQFIVDKHSKIPVAIPHGDRSSLIDTVESMIKNEGIIPPRMIGGLIGNRYHQLVKAKIASGKRYGSESGSEEGKSKEGGVFYQRYKSRSNSGNSQNEMNRQENFVNPYSVLNDPYDQPVVYRKGSFSSQGDN